MGRVTSYGTKGTETGATLVDRLYRPDATKPAVIFCHGLNGRAWHPVNFPDPVIDLMAGRGFPVSSHDLGGQATWGNDTAQTKVADARSYMQGSMGAKAGKVLLWAGSMGALAALNFARGNPTLVAAVAAAVPANSLADLYNDAPARDPVNAGFPASIDAAYGGSMDATERAAHSPAEHAGEYAALGVPIKLWYSTNDTSILPATVTDFAAAAGCEAVSMGAVGHTFNASFSEDVADFLEAYR